MAETGEVPQKEMELWDPDRDETLEVGDEQDEEGGSIHQRDLASSIMSAPPASGIKKALSVHSAMGILCVMCIIISSCTTEILQTVACDEGLSDTRDTMDKALDAMVNTSHNSLGSVSSQLMGYAASGVGGMLHRHMSVANQEIVRLSAIAYKYKGDPESVAFIDAVQASIWQQSATMLPDNPVGGGISLFTGDYGIGMYANEDSGYTNTSAVWDGEKVIYSFYITPSRKIAAPVEPHTGISLLDSPYAVPLLLDMNELPGVATARSPGFMEFGEQKYTQIQPIGDFIGYTYVAKLLHSSGKQVDASVYISLGDIGNYLNTMLGDTANTTARTRVFCTVRTSWLYNATLRIAPNTPNLEDLNQVNMLTGVSQGTSTEEYTGIDALTGYTRTLRRPLYDVNATDYIIRGVARDIAGDYAGVVAAGTRFVTLQNDDGVEETFVAAASHMNMQGIGLDWWISTVVDADSIYGDVLAEEIKLRKNIELEKGRVEDDYAAQQTITKIVTAAVGIVLVVISLFLSYKILRPIKTMQQNMSFVANMELESAELKYTSHLYELRLMQRDFRKMVENLLEFRAYVPISVLESNGYSGEGGKVVATPPTGNVAIVFTDIKGSTALWKSSAGDMNAAMEIHNEVMRDACEEFSGYEVKTIGDAFMVSFPCQFAAAKFALTVQTNLAKKKWPKGLELPEAGLVVRIGINYGSTIAEENPVTGRVDYRGSTVNLASRVEAKAKGGTICITSDMYAAIKPDMEGLGGPAVTDHGLHDIKGLGNGHQLYLMVAAPLKRRFKDSETDTEIRKGEGVTLDVNADTLFTPDTGPSQRKSGSAASKSSALSKNSKQKRKEKDDKAKRTALHVQRSSATVAVCRLKQIKGDSQLFDNCNIMVRAAMEAAASTDGVIGNVTGSTVTVVWNASKKCAMHTTAALNFVSEMKKLQGIMQVGLATGTVLHGNVGTKTSRFATSFGMPLEAAEAVTCHANNVGVYCLYADCTSDKRLESDNTVRSCLRLVDAWLDDTQVRVLRIYEVHLPSLASALQGWGGGDSMDYDEECIDLEHHSDVVQKAMQGPEGLVSLKQLAEETSDPVLLTVLGLMEADAPTEGFRCATRFARYQKVERRAPSGSVSHLALRSPGAPSPFTSNVGSPSTPAE